MRFEIICEQSFQLRGSRIPRVNGLFYHHLLYLLSPSPLAMFSMSFILPRTNKGACVTTGSPDVVVLVKLIYKQQSRICM